MNAASRIGAEPGPSLDVLVIGEAIVDFVPLHRGPLRHTSGLEMHSGGAPANVSIGVSRLGARSGLISVVGDDEFGHFLRGSLQREGVDIRRVRTDPRTQTALCFITLDQHGERSFLHRGGDPALSLDADDIDPLLAHQARAVKFSSGPLRTPEGVQAVERLIDSTNGVVTCDPGTCPGHWASAETINARLHAVLPRCHVVKCSHVEAKGITGEEQPERAAARLVALGVDLAVVTLGARGAIYARARDAGHIETPPVQVVDTTGAGDAFMAALLTRIASDPKPPGSWTPATLRDHLRFACEIGAGAVTRRGAIDGIPRRPRPAA